MKVTIIGGSGFVGTRLMDVLKPQADFHITNIDKQQSRFFPESTVLADVLDKKRIITLLKGTDVVILLAAEHRDDVRPVSRYYEVNVQGMRNVLEAMQANGISRIVFTSSVAVYGLDKANPSETFPADPFNHYGKSKWQAEQVLQQWYAKHAGWSICVIRPTVIFGERNRGNVYNLLHQIARGHFLMVGRGNNKKSMAYVGNVVAFIRFLLENQVEGHVIYNYVDKPDMNMNELVEHVGKTLNRKVPTWHIPYAIGICGGYMFDLLSKITGKKHTVSSVRVRKFCATTQFDATKTTSSGFVPAYTLKEGLAQTLRYEFQEKRIDEDPIFRSE